MSGWLNVEQFKREAENYLKRFGVKTLHAYGRSKGLRIATMLKKDELIKQTIAICCGEQAPDFTARGAPRKNDFVPPELIGTMEELVRVYLRGETPATTTFPAVKDEKKEEKPYYKITVQTREGVEVMSVGTSLDFQIVLSNQKAITRQDTAKELDEKTL